MHAGSMWGGIPLIIASTTQGWPELPSSSNTMARPAVTAGRVPNHLNVWRRRWWPMRVVSVCYSYQRCHYLLGPLLITQHMAEDAAHYKHHKPKKRLGRSPVRFLCNMTPT